MGLQLIESTENGKKVYDSILVEPNKLNIFGSPLAVKIIKELATEPSCAMDLSRKLDEHEQKIYYHIRKLAVSGIIKKIRTEKRQLMTANIYGLVSPVVSTMLFDNGVEIDDSEAPIRERNPKIEEFLQPFVEDGRLNAKIIVSSPYPHGKYEATGRITSYASDFCLFIGSFLRETNPSALLDTEVREGGLKENLIILGGPKINTVSDKINPHLPVYFDRKSGWAIFSTFSNQVYNYDYDAVILRIKNPFGKGKEILLLAGQRSQGLRSALIAFINHIDEIEKGNSYNKEIIAKVVRGIDKDGDGVIDSVEFLE